MIGTFLASDGFVYYIFWELSLIPIYFIALIWGNGDAEERKKAVIKFFIYTFAGSLFMLAAFIYLYQKAGCFKWDVLVSLNLTATEEFWIFLAFFLAYAIKIPLIPFHTWQANVYQKAPTIGTMLLSGIMLKMGLYSVLRWQLPLAPNAAKELQYIIIGLALAGVVYGSIVALKTKRFKEIIGLFVLSTRWFDCCRMLRLKYGRFTRSCFADDCPRFCNRWFVLRCRSDLQTLRNPHHQ